MLNNDNIILKYYETKIFVSRYVNKQLTIFSKNTNIKEKYNSYGFVIPYFNKYNKYPIILDTINKDNKIFENIEECFNDKNDIFTNINKFFYYMNKKEEKVENNKIINEENYLTIIYNDYYKYSIAQNIKEIDKLNKKEFNFIINIENIKEFEKDDYGFIILSIRTYNKKNIIPFAILTDIKDNKFFIPTKHLNFLNMYLYNDNIIRNNKSKSYEYLQKSKNTILKYISNDENNVLNSIDTFISSIDSNDPSNIDLLKEFIKFDFKIYVLHSSENNNNILKAKYDFNPYYTDCTFNKYLKYCISKKILKIVINGFEKDDNLWYKIENDINNIFIF